MKEQVLDSMDIERERGITIKAQTVRLDYRADDGEDYVLNLMDTPGHVDFAYEVCRVASPPARARSWWWTPARASRPRPWPMSIRPSTTTMRSCRSSTRSTCPPPSRTGCAQQIEDVIGIDASDAVESSAKTGLGIHEVLEAIVTRLPPPKGDADAPLKALLVDAWYDAYLGVVVLVRVFDGRLKHGQQVKHDADRRGLSRRQARRVQAQGDRRRRSSAPARSASSPPPSRK